MMSKDRNGGMRGFTLRAVSFRAVDRKIIRFSIHEKTSRFEARIVVGDAGNIEWSVIENRFN